MTVRKVVTRRSNHFRGYFPSLKNGKPVPWESQLEGAFFRLLELSPEVTSYTAQPSEERIPFGSTFITYYPDLRVLLADGREWWFEVKPYTRLQIVSVKQRLDASAAHFDATGRNFTVVTDELIEAQPLAANLKVLMYYRRGPMFSNAQGDEVREILNTDAPETISELKAIFGEMEAWRLLGLGIVGIDLEKAIGNASEVFLVGGHRHANFFA